jgi:hypothetical protein
MDKATEPANSVKRGKHRGRGKVRARVSIEDPIITAGAASADRPIAKYPATARAPDGEQDVHARPR